MSLTDEINARSKEINVSSYPMSIGEIASLFRDGELNIHPEFQRFYRWTDSQKTALIESLLLNIPVPPIYVVQLDSGIWEVVDGLQRISTILQFMGLCKDADGAPIAPLKLMATRFLPSLNNKYYSSEDPENSFNSDEQRFFKRAKLDFVIINRQSDPSAKYELFQRLNTGGTSLSEQEMRNCIIVSENPDVFRKLKEAAEYESFRAILAVSENDLAKRADMDLLCRFIALRTADFDEFRNYRDFGVYMTERLRGLINNSSWNVNDELEIFRKITNFLNEALQIKSFQRYYHDSGNGEGRFKGGLLMGAFEMVAITLGRLNGETEWNPAELEERLKRMWQFKLQRPEWTGKNVFDRVKIAVRLGELLYGQEEIQER